MADEHRRNAASSDEKASEPDKAKTAGVPTPAASEASAKNANADAEALRAELQRAKKENAELKAKAAEPAHPGRGRMVGAMTLIVIGCLLASLAVPAVWLENTVLNTDTWVATVGPLASEPAIQTYVADKATAALFEQVDVKGYVDQVLALLPPKAQPLAAPLSGPITEGIKGFVHTQAVRFTQSPQFAQVWIQVNTVGHKAIVNLLTGKTTFVQADNTGKVTLDIGLIIDAVKKQLSANGMGFVNKLPTSSLNRQIVLFQSSALGSVIVAVAFLQASALILPILALLFLVGAIALATDRRKSIVWIGIGIVIAMLLPLEALYLAQFPLISALAKASVPAEVATILYNTIFAGLRTMQRGLVVVGLVVWIVAMLFGPARWAVALRSAFKNGLGSMAASWDFGKFGAFVARNKPALRGLGVGIGAVVLLVTAGRTPWMIFWTAVGVVVWLALVEVFGHDVAPADASGQSSSA
jgi:hypothetical protein